MPSDPKALGHEDTEKALERAKNLTEGRRLSMQERQDQWLAKKAEKAAKLQAEKEERENANCSFMPKIKKTTSTRLRRPSVEIPPPRRPSVLSGQPVTLEALPVVSPGGTVIKDAQGREPASPSKRRVSIDPATKKGLPTRAFQNQHIDGIYL